MPKLLIFSVAAATCVATLLGGWFGMAMRDRLHLVLGFSAGAVVGVAFFDLLPEALNLGQSLGSRSLLTLAALGFALYLLLDRLLAGNGHVERDPRRGSAAAGGFSIHSFLDGFAIGIAFQAGRGVGIAVSVAVLAHDFSDGLNTVSVVLRNGGDRRSAWRWLLVDAVAPLLGALSSLVIRMPAPGLAVVLALFGGFFLYVGASDLLPESQHAHPRRLTTLVTLLGVGFMYAIARVAG